MIFRNEGHDPGPAGAALVEVDGETGNVKTLFGDLVQVAQLFNVGVVVIDAGAVCLPEDGVVVGIGKFSLCLGKGNIEAGGVDADDFDALIQDKAYGLRAQARMPAVPKVLSVS